MKTILAQPAYIVAALGKQDVDAKTKYRPIQFLIFSECADGYLVYNTMTKQLVLVDSDEYDILRGKKDADIKQNIELIFQYFLVPLEFDEKKCSKQLKNMFGLLDNDNSITSYVILTTTDCNARCFYCCEHGQKRIAMTEKTAADVAKFIAEKSNGKQVYIMWFGGEPLFNYEPINIISDYLTDSGITYKTNMISNAYLFDEKIIKTAKEKWNVQSVQITLDGTKKIYNKTKAYIYKDEINPFEKVINNIELIAESEIKVIVRLNMDLFNKDDLYQLVDYLYERFAGNKYVVVYVRMLFDNTSKVQLDRTNDERRLLYSEFTKFENYIVSKGMYNNRRLHAVYAPNTCIGTNKHGTVIMPGGELGLCDLHSDSDIYGDIYNGVTNQKVIDEFMVYKEPVSYCDTCAIFPDCTRLKKCIYYTRDCEEYERDRLIEQMQKYVLHTYQYHKEHNK